MNRSSPFLSCVTCLERGCFKMGGVTQHRSARRWPRQFISQRNHEWSPGALDLRDRGRRELRFPFPRNRAADERNVGTLVFRGYPVAALLILQFAQAFGGTVFDGLLQLFRSGI